VLIDIAVPRDIDPEVQSVPNVYLYDIDDLEAIVRENVKTRSQELTHCQSIIRAEAAAVMARIFPEPRETFRPPGMAEAAWRFSGTPACAV
jgi:glutamyl-tRNA reductase